MAGLNTEASAVLSSACNKMKTLIILGVLMLIFTSCGTLPPQELQQERLRLLAAYEAARQKHNPEKVKDAVKDLLVGKWQYVALEVEEGNLLPKMAQSTPQAALKSVTSFMERLSKGTKAEQTKAPNASEDATSSNPPNSDEGKQNSEANATRLPRIEVTDEKSTQQILAAKTTLVASTRQNLTVEFFEDRGSYNYRGSNSGRRVTGQCYITTKRYGDDPFPFIRFNQRTGQEMLAFLFGSEAVKQIAARQKQKRVAMMQNRNIGIYYARRDAAKRASFSAASMAGVTVTADRLYFVLYSDMQLTPKGWVHTGGLRCTFKRIE